MREAQAERPFPTSTAPGGLRLPAWLPRLTGRSGGTRPALTQPEGLEPAPPSLLPRALGSQIRPPLCCQPLTPLSVARKSFRKEAHANPHGAATLQGLHAHVAQRPGRPLQRERHHPRGNEAKRGALTAQDAREGGGTTVPGQGETGHPPTERERGLQEPSHLLQDHLSTRNISEGPGGVGPGGWEEGGLSFPRGPGSGQHSSTGRGCPGWKGRTDLARGGRPAGTQAGSASHSFPSGWPVSWQRVPRGSLRAPTNRGC